MNTEKSWDSIKINAYKTLDPILFLINRTKITPNILTTIGFGINVLAAIILVAGAEYGYKTDYRFITWFGVTLLFSGLFDMLDGQLARKNNKTTVFGALYDSVLDRYSEMVMFLGICYYLVSYNYFLSSVFAFIAMIGSIMVSYVRARAEGLGFECKVGLMQRPERIILIGVTSILYGIIYSLCGEFKFTAGWLPIPLFENISIFTFPIFIMAVLTNYTAIQRLRYCHISMK